MALKKHGSKDLNLISTYLPSRSIIEIRHMIDVYKKKAEIKMSKSSENHSEADWLKVVKNIQFKTNRPKVDLVSRALKYISMFEKRKEESDIDLSACYQYLSDICSAKTPKDLSERDDYFMKTCLLKLIETVQKRRTSESDRKRIRYLQEMTVLDDIIELKINSVTNPLSVPRSLLKLSKDELET